MRIALSFVAWLASGCSSLGHLAPGGGKLAHLDGRHPYHVGLYISPELETLTASLATPAGEETSVEMGRYLHRALERATRGAFERLTRLSKPSFTPAGVIVPQAQEIWPEEPKVKPKREPDLILACYPVTLHGRLLGMANCGACRESAAFRVEIRFEIRQLDGTLLAEGRVSGQGVTDREARHDMPLPARFRAAAAEAADRMVTQYRLVLHGTRLAPLAVPELVPEDERFASAARPLPAGRRAGP
jgi:hypothetical protein